MRVRIARFSTNPCWSPCFVSLYCCPSLRPRFRLEERGIIVSCGERRCYCSDRREEEKRFLRGKDRKKERHRRKGKSKKREETVRETDFGSAHNKMLGLDQGHTWEVVMDLERCSVVWSHVHTSGRLLLRSALELLHCSIRDRSRSTV